MTTPFLKNLDSLAQNSRVVIYGAGDLGQTFFQHVTSQRPDVTVVAVIDSHKQGSLGNCQLLTFADFLQNKPSFDLMIIATLIWADEVILELQSAGINQYMVSLLYDISGTTIFDKWHQFQDKIDTVYQLLEEQADRNLWSTIMQSMRTKNNSELVQWFIAHPGTQYLDHISLQEGNVVIEGGVFDGTDTARLAQRVGATGRVYGFDPLIMTGTQHDKQCNIAAQKNVELVTMALWDKTGQIFFNNQGSDSIVSGHQESDTVAVQAITIDDFAISQALTRLDYIKLDVEGAEPQVLAGAANSIQRFRPQLAVSIYHDISHFFDIPIYLANCLTDYKFHLWSYASNFGDIVLYAIPRK